MMEMMREVKEYHGVTTYSVSIVHQYCRECLLASQAKQDKLLLQASKRTFPVHGCWVRHQVDLIDRTCSLPERTTLEQARQETIL